MTVQSTPKKYRKFVNFKITVLEIPMSIKRPN
jgi:hypothetical protein